MRTGKGQIMVIKKKYLLIILGLCILAALFAASCANLPSKVVPAPAGNESTPAPEVVLPADNPEISGSAGNPGDDAYLIQNSRNDVWTEPQSDATVTPVVLFVEKKGEMGGVIVRDVPPVEFDSNTFVYATPAPDVSYGGLKDEMEVVGFAPVSGAVVLPNQFMHLDVTLRNTGTTTWLVTYSVADVSAAPMTVEHVNYLPYAVAPQGTVLLSIFMTAPQELGSYTASFEIRDAYGAVFGNFDYVLTVGGFSSITEIPTLTATVTPTYYSAEGITATPDSLAWMCIDPERSKLQDCYQFCVEYSDREEFKFCFYDGNRYTTPIP